MDKVFTTPLRYGDEIVTCSQILLTEAPNTLHEFLEHLLHISGVSRVYVFENIDDPHDGLCMKQTYEACASGILPQINSPNLQHLPYKQGAPQLYHSLSQGKPYTGLVADFSQEERAIFEPQGILSILIVPIRIGGKWLGFIGFDDITFPRKWNNDDIKLLQTAASMLGAYLERKRAEKFLQHTNEELEARVEQRTAELRRVNEELSMLFEISQTIVAPLNVEYVLDILARNTAELLHSDTAAILLVDDAEGILKIAGAYQLSDRIVQHTQERIGQSIAGRVVLTGEPIIANHLPQDPRFENHSADSEGLLACASVPLRVGSKIIGTLDAHSKTNPDMFTERHITLMTMLASQAAIALENARLYEQLQHSHEVLEQRVKERTAEFQTANEQLTQEITRRKDAESTLRQVNQQLEELNQQKSDFLAGMSHELRTPLNSVLGFCEVLQEELYGPLNEKQFRALGGIEESGRHLLDLINDILDIAKIEAGRLDLEIDTVSIAQIAQISLLFIKQAAAKKHLNISFHPDSTVKTLQTDEHRLKQILVNLLYNAVKFTPERGTISLETGADRSKDLIYFSVRDSGVGITQEQQQHLFEPFVQLGKNPIQHQEGSGLGLTLVYHLVTLLGGQISVISKKGQGSCFTVAFPLKLGELEGLLGEEIPHHQQGGAKEMNSVMPITVLLAEDSPEGREMLSEYLQTIGYQVILAKNGQEALTLVRAQPPDIILMDIQMPVMDGLEAIRHLKADAHLTNIPVIALTALAMRRDRERCIEAGADSYLSKPVSLKKMLHLIQTLTPGEKNAPL